MSRHNAGEAPAFQIRCMTEADLSQVMAIERESFSIPWREESFRDMLPRPETIFLVAEELPGAAVILGYAGAVVAAGEGDVTNIAVRGEHKRKGIAAALLGALLRETIEAGVRDLFLEVREHNLPAISLYRDAGFSEVGRRKGYYDRPKEDALIMKRTADL